MPENDSCQHPLDKLPWTSILKEINESYYKMVEDKYGNGQNKELEKILMSTKFNSVVTPYGDAPDIKYIDNFFGDAAEKLNKVLNSILERHAVPPVLRNNMILSSIQTNTFISSHAPTPPSCYAKTIDICGDGSSMKTFWCC